MTTLLLLVALAVFLMAGFFLVTSLLAAFSMEPTEAQPRAAAAPEREALLAKKASLLVSLKDLRFDREAGKLSGDDFDKLNAQLRAEAKEVLKALDADLRPFLEQAEQLALEAGGPVSLGEASEESE